MANAVDTLLKAAREMDLPDPDPEDPFAPDDYNREARQFARAGLTRCLEVRAEQFGLAPLRHITRDLMLVDAEPPAAAPEYDRAAGAAFLRRLFDGYERGFMEFRTAAADGTRPRLFVPVDAIGDEAEWVNRHNARGRPVWVGVALRRTATHGRADNCAPLRWLWVDIDWKDYKGGETEARRRLARFSPAPSFVVETGGGLHVYWSVPPIDGANWRVTAQARLRRLAADLGADAHAVDVARVLRLPGTLNAKYTPARPVQMLEAGLL